MVKIFIHVALAPLAFVIFWMGVVAGLQISSTLGKYLMIAAVLIFFGNIVWLYLSIKWWRK